ncbi:MAG: hypothetical protein NTV29_19695 [Planctomycetota bacterium]|nr:hypothetical protein [Planctomycetota bacterium]
MLFKILPLLWMAFIAAVILLPTIAALTGRPKGPSKPKKAKSKKKKKGDPEPEESSEDVPPEPTLDFGDEVAQMQSARG